MLLDLHHFITFEKKYFHIVPDYAAVLSCRLAFSDSCSEE